MKLIAFLVVCLMTTVTWADEPRLTQQITLRNSGTASGVMHLHAGKWGMLRATVHNPTDQNQEAVYALRFDEMPSLQFVTPVWIPPRSQRQVYIPLRGAGAAADRLPSSRRGGLEIMRGEALLIDVTRQPERRIVREQALIMKRSDRPVTGRLISNIGDGKRSSELVSAMRVATNLSTTVSGLRDTELPHFTAGWEGLDHMVISRHRPELDAAQMESLRQWIASGGRLWIMIDQVDTNFVASLLREAWTCSILDTVDLTDVCIRRHTPGDTRSWPRAAHTVRVDRNEKIDLDGHRLAGIAEFAREITADLAEAPTQDDRTIVFSHADALPHERMKSWQHTVTQAGGIIAATQRTYEQPVTLARLFASGWEVLQTVNGWPASLRRRVGRGWVLMTTLGPRGWMRVREASDMDGAQSAASPEAAGDDSSPSARVVYPPYYARPALRELATWFNQLPVRELVPPERLRAMAGSQIDYRVMARRTVTAVLGLFVVGLAVVGACLHWRRRLEFLGIIGGVGAACVSVLLVVMGHAHRHKLPLTMASVRVVRLPPEEPYAVMSGVVGIYAPDEDIGTVHASSGAIFWPDLLTQKKDPLRMVWSDLSVWKWKNLHLPSGQPRGGGLRHVATLAAPVQAHMTFGPQGVEGWIDPGVLLRCAEARAEQLDDAEVPDALRTAFRDRGIELSMSAKVATVTPGAQWTIEDEAQIFSVVADAAGVAVQAFADPHDLLLLTPHGRMAPRLADGIRFSATGADVLGGEDFMPSRSGMITDVQQRRAQVVRALPERLYHDDVHRGRRFAPRQEPTLLAWSSSMDLGFDLGHPHARRDVSLLVMPVRINRPAPGTRVSLPAPFITLVPIRGPRVGSRGAARMNPLYYKGEWIESTAAGNALMRFQLPQEVLPIHVDRAKLKIRIRAPHRRLLVAHGAGDDRIVLYDKNAQDGTFTVDLTENKKVLSRFDVRGGLELNISVSEVLEGSPALSTWKILDLGMSVEGVAEGGAPDVRVTLPGARARRRFAFARSAGTPAKHSRSTK